MKPILIIGATGRVGRQVVPQLVATGTQVRAMARNPTAARLSPQVEVVQGDLTVPETLDRCFDGIDTVFLVWTAPPTAVASALERITKHARRIVFLSAPLKTAHPFFQQPNPLRTMFEQIERLIETSAVHWTFLRPGMFAANALNWWAPQIRVGDVVRWPYLAAPTAPVDEGDIAAVAVQELCEDGHTGAEYVLTGPQSLSQFEQVSAIGRVIGRSLRNRRDLDRRGTARTAHHRAVVCGEYAAHGLGCRYRPACARDLHGRRDHGNTRKDVPRLGSR
jgi:uncharacterized protein YbjT (DUF2867 family)